MQMVQNEAQISDIGVEPRIKMESDLPLLNFMISTVVGKSVKVLFGEAFSSSAITVKVQEIYQSVKMMKINCFK